MNCFKCGCEGLMKNGFVGGVQRYKCKNCNYQATRFTPRGYSEKDKSLALLLYVSGVSMNRIGKIIGVTAQSVMRWIKASAALLKPRRTSLASQETLVLEIDEMCHFLKKRAKNSGFGRFMIVSLEDVLPGSWVIVPAQHSKPSPTESIPF